MTRIDKRFFFQEESAFGGAKEDELCVLEYKSRDINHSNDVRIIITLIASYSISRQTRCCRSDRGGINFTNRVVYNNIHSGSVIILSLFRRARNRTKSELIFSYRRVMQFLLLFPLSAAATTTTTTDNRTFSTSFKILCIF